MTNEMSHDNPLSDAAGDTGAADLAMASVVSISVTAKGREMAAGLPYANHHGSPRETLERLWGEVDGFVLFLAVPAAVRLVAGLVSTKEADPAVVCIDQAGRFAVPICGGHAGSVGTRSKIGANALAKHLSLLTGAQAAITTATDASGIPSMEQIPDMAAEGDIPRLTTAMLDGHLVSVGSTLEWPRPVALEGSPGASGEQADVVITDRSIAPRAGQVLLRPPSLVVGVGASTEATGAEMIQLFDSALAAAGLSRHSVKEIATISSRGSHPAVVGLGLPIVAFEASELAAVEVPNPSPVVDSAVGTPSVAEAAALLAAGPGAELVCQKLRSGSCTLAIARRSAPRGKLSVVGTGPGSAWLRSPACQAAIRHAEVVIGYGPYVEQVEDLTNPTQSLLPYPIGAEVERASEALRLASLGRRVALVCSGDPGIFAMAPIVLEVAEQRPDWDAEIEVLTGITASLAASAALGAPLGHDHAVISLSDLHTPWEVIEARVDAAGRADLVVVFYNPRSATRIDQLPKALAILGAYRSASTPVGVVRNVSRPGEKVLCTTLGDLDPTTVDMYCSVIVGSTTTRMVRSMMLTPRGASGLGQKKHGLVEQSGTHGALGESVESC